MAIELWHGGIAEWQYGGMAGMAEWRNGGMAESRMAGMAEWQNGGMAGMAGIAGMVVMADGMVDGGDGMVDWHKWLHTYYLRHTPTTTMTPTL